MTKYSKNNLVLIGSGGHASVVASLSKTIGLKIKFIAVPFALAEQNAISDIKYLTDGDLMSVRNKHDYILLNGVGQKIRCNLRANLFSKFKNLGFDISLPFSEKVINRMLLLPLNMTITDEEVKYVCEKIKFFYNN